MRRTVDTREVAEQIQETFYGKSVRRQTKLSCGWPDTMILCGTVISVIYKSDKWYFDNALRPYMHIAEAPQELLVRQGFVKNEKTMRPRELFGEEVELVEPMPQHIARLTPCFGIRADLFSAYRGNRPVKDGEQGIYEIRTPGAMLGGIEHPTTGEKFLVVYTKERVHALITGRELDIEEDGITG